MLDSGNGEIVFPSELAPTSNGEISFDDGTVIAKTCPEFQLWRGITPADSYGGKAFLNYCGEILFAELAILRILDGSDWSGVWVDTLRKRFSRTLNEETAILSAQWEILVDSPGRRFRLEKDVFHTGMYLNQNRSVLKEGRSAESKTYSTARKICLCNLARVH